MNPLARNQCYARIAQLASEVERLQEKGKKVRFNIDEKKEISVVARGALQYIAELFEKLIRAVTGKASHLATTKRIQLSESLFSLCKETLEHLEQDAKENKIDFGELNKIKMNIETINKIYEKLYTNEKINVIENINKIHEILYINIKTNVKIDELEKRCKTILETINKKISLKNWHQLAEAFLLELDQTKTGLLEMIKKEKVEAKEQRRRIENLIEILIEPLRREIVRLQSQMPKKYDQQIILDLGSGRSAGGLNAKAKRNKLPSETINLRKKNFNLSPLSKLTPASRLYIIGHSDSGVNSVEDDNGKKFTANRIATMLNQYAPQLKTGTSEYRVKISVIACNGGLNGEGGSTGFAYSLSRALDTFGIPAEILGRTGEVDRWKGKPEHYRKTVEGKHHAPGSKLIFITEGGKTSKRTFIY